MESIEKRFLSNCGFNLNEIKKLNEVLNRSVNDKDTFLKWGNKQIPVEDAQQYILHIITQFLQTKNLDYAFSNNETRYNLVLDVKLRRDI